MLRFVFLTSLFHLSTIGYGQLLPPNNAPKPRFTTVDSLHRSLNATTSDTGRVVAFNALASYYRNYSSDSSLIYSQKALLLAEKVPWRLGMGNALMLQGTVNRILGNFPVAMEQLQKAMPHFEAANDNRGIAYVYNNIGLVYLREDKKKEAADYFANGLRYAKQANDREAISIALNNLGLVVRSQQRYDSAIYYFRESYKLAHYRQDYVVMANNLRNIGISHQLAGRIDSALYYLPLARRQYQSANSPSSESVATLAIARIYLQQGKLTLAENLADSVLAITSKLGAKEQIRDAYLLRYEIHKQTGKIAEALSNYEQYVAYKDSVFGEEKVKMLANLQANFELQKAKQQNEELTTQQKNARLLMIMGIAGFTLLLIGLLILWNNIRQKKLVLGQLLVTTKEIEQQYEAADKQQAAIVDANLQLRAQNKVLADLNREQEGLISIVAHDLRSPFTQVRGLVQLIRMGGPLTPDQEQCLQMAERASDGGMALIRDILYASELENKQANLNIEAIQINSWMGHFLRNYAPMAENKLIQLVTHPPTTDFSCLTDQASLKRILDNLISNALKFSPFRTSITIKWWLEQGVAFFAIKDQGPGLSAEDQGRLFTKFQKLNARPTGGEDSTGLGLAIVKVLAERLGGRVEVSSQLGHGAEFVLSLPQSAKLPE